MRAARAARLLFRTLFYFISLLYSTNQIISGVHVAIAVVPIGHYGKSMIYNTQISGKNIAHKTGLKNEKMKILRDMKIQTDKIADHSTADVVRPEKESRYCNTIDVSCTFDARVLEKEKEKVDKYQDLKWKLEDLELQ